jgi:hypothetical protein
MSRRPVVSPRRRSFAADDSSIPDAATTNLRIRTDIDEYTSVITDEPPETSVMWLALRLHQMKSVRILKHRARVVWSMNVCVLD